MFTHEIHHHPAKENEICLNAAINLAHSKLLSSKVKDFHDFIY